MRVALLSTYNEQCGIATYTEALSAALAGRGVDIVHLAPRRKSGDAGRGEQPPRMWNRNRAFGFEALAVHRKLVALRVDVAHLQVNLSLFSSRFAFSLATLCARSRVPLVVTLHGRKRGEWGPDFKWSRLHWAFRGADLIVHGESHRGDFARDRVRVHVVPHGVDPVIDGDRQGARRELGLPEDAQVITHFGFLVRDKGVDEVLRAVAELRENGHPALRYDICGAVYAEGESRAYFAELQALTEALALRDAVRLTGEFVDDERMLREMHASDWIVLNYRTGTGQGASGAARRALSSGRPVAVSSAPIFDDVRAAVHTMEAPIVGALERLLLDDDLAERTRQRARAFCEENSWSHVAERHEMIYRAARERVASGGASR
jgi:glycosyltransferase involved in cell wall biosynthesis